MGMQLLRIIFFRRNVFADPPFGFGIITVVTESNPIQVANCAVLSGNA